MQTRAFRVLVALVVMLSYGCGREPSSLLRQGELPIYDFPLYLTLGTAGQLWKLDRDRSMTMVMDGLNDPRGIATDRFGNVYLAEYGGGRVLKMNAKSGASTVIKDSLQSPSVVAVDSFGEVYIAQDGTHTISRVSDDKVFGTYAALPTALAFGVNDQPLVGLFDTNRVVWSWDALADKGADVTAPVNASVDGTGRVYVAQGDPTNGQVLRYHQRDPGNPTVVADKLLGPMGIATDLVGNVFVVEQGAGRIVLITFDGKRYAWESNLTDPQYLAFTQY